MLSAILISQINIFASGILSHTRVRKIIVKTSKGISEL
jgi:hypothetical protein